MADKICEIISLANIFSSEYNKLNNTNYCWKSDKDCFEPGEPFDFRLFDGDKSIGVQVTRNVADEMREYVKPDKAGKVISIVKENLESKGYKSLQIYVNFHKPPEKDEDIKLLAFWLEFIITEKSNEDATAFSWKLKFDDYMKQISPYVSELEIKHTEQCNIFGWSSFDIKPQKLKSIIKEKIRTEKNSYLLGWSNSESKRYYHKYTEREIQEVENLLKTQDLHVCRRINENHGENYKNIYLVGKK